MEKELRKFIKDCKYDHKDEIREKVHKMESDKIIKYRAILKSKIGNLEERAIYISLFAMLNSVTGASVWMQGTVEEVIETSMSFFIYCLIMIGLAGWSIISMGFKGKYLKALSYLDDYSKNENGIE